MGSRELTPFGKRTRERLQRLNRDDDWLIEQFKKRGLYINRERYEDAIFGEIKSRPLETTIGKVLTEEEDIQRVAKMLGIRRQ